MKKVFIDEKPDYSRRNIKDELFASLTFFLIIAGLSSLLVSEEEKGYHHWGLLLLFFLVIFIFGFSTGTAYHIFYLAIDGNTVTMEFLETEKFFKLRPQKITFNIERTNITIVRNDFFRILDANKRRILEVDLSKHKDFDKLWKEVLEFHKSHKV